MKQWHSEFLHNYETYTFGYGAYATLEKGDDLSHLYSLGYLPYSGARGVSDFFYMARSGRVDLSRFSLSSENRRILKKFENGVETSDLSADVWAKNETLVDFSLQYFTERHGALVMPRERLELILAHRVVPQGIRYDSDGKLLALVLLNEGGSMQHFWYSFYDVALINQSLGLWLMTDALIKAKEEGLRYMYLGTVYGEKALYKTNFEGFEWWDGAKWSDNVEELKARGRDDAARSVTSSDLWKGGLELF